MGEWSKKIGEVGEEIVGEFLNLIGWGDSQKGLSLPCIKNQNHGSNKSLRTTHGIDYLFSHESQLIDRTVDNLVISVKYTSAPYPSTPNGKFKEHFLDLAKTIECFKRSEIKRNANSHFSGIERARNVGVLFWLSHDSLDTDDVMQKVARVKGIDENNYDLIYVVDNKRVSFIYDTIKYLEKEKPQSRIEFFYQDTGKNNNPLNKKSSGTILPVDFLNSGILLIKLINPDNTKTFVVSVIDEFDQNSFKRLMGLSLKTMHDFAQDSLILFPDFDILSHENQVREAKSSFRDREFTNSVRVRSYRTDFQSCEASSNKKTAFTNSLKPINKTESDEDKSNDKPFQDIEHFLPYGEMLRVLIKQSFISKSELKALLRNRGVFTASSEKQDTIPILASTILTPEEFSFLRENQNSKEDNPKNNTRIIEWQSTNNLSDSIPEFLDVSSISNPEFDNYKVIREPNFVLVNSNPNHLKMDYSIERNDMSKSLATEKREFEGSLELIRIPETNVVKIITTHTAEETKIVGSKVFTNILKHFKNEGNINPSKQVEKILFSSFTNSDRITYLFSLTKYLDSLVLEFVDIVDIKFSPDESLSLPDYLIWIQGKIEDLKLNGKKLHSTLFFQKQSPNFLHLYNVDSKFKFNLKFNEKNLTGECVMSIGFPDYEKDKENINSEMEINIKNINFEAIPKGFSRAKIKQALLKEIEDIKITNFKKYKINENEPQLLAIGA